jgi:hypothetical protein
MATVLARYPLTASGRAQASGHLDRLGLGVEYLHEVGDELLALVPNYSGDEDAANAHFEGAASIEHNAMAGKAPKAGESEDWEPRIEIAGEIIERPASAREPQAPPEVQADPPSNVQDEHAPDTATRPSPGLSGAAQSQATRDKANIAEAQGDDQPAKPAPKAESKADSKAKK